MTLPTVLDPYSAWVLTHRNTVIVVLGLVLFAVACHALIMRWRVESLQRELSRAPERSERTPVYTPSRPSLVQQPEPEPAQPGGLPPVRGGRSYARNLGTALQKSGVPAAAPIYSPPTPQGWIPNAAPPQTGRPSAPPFAPNAGPWGPPAPPAPMAWPPMAPGAAPGAPQLGGPPAMPGFPPSPGPQPWPGFAPQPSPAAAGPMPPGTAAPTPPMAPFGVPMPPGGQPFGHGGPPPQAQAGTPLTPIQSPASYPGFQPPVAPPAPAPESGKRGKPKRRRFNLSVLEGIEKKIQALPSSLPRAAAPAEAPASPAAVTPPPAAPIAPLPTLPGSEPATAAFAPAGPSASAEAASRIPAGAASDAEGPKGAVEAEAEAGATSERSSRSQSARDRRAALRSMMFGEEPASSRSAAPPEAPEEPSASVAEQPETENVLAETESDPDALAQTSQAAEPAPAEAQAAAEEPAFTFTPDDGEASAADRASSIPGWQAEPPAGMSDGDFGQETVAAQPEPPATEGSVIPVVEDGARQAQSEPEPAAATAEEAVEPTQASDEVPPLAAEDARPSAGTMVIIEDDAAVAEYYATLFRGNGYRVEVAHDGVSGVDVCARVQPNVILLDVMMPRQNGILVLQTLRASDETRNTPVVVLSNFSEPTLIKRALQLGALEYVIKTQVEGSALLQAVPRWMNREKAFAAA